MNVQEEEIFLEVLEGLEGQRDRGIRVLYL